MQGISWGADVILVSVSPSKLRDSGRRFYLLADSAASLGQLIPVATFSGRLISVGMLIS